MRRHYTYLKPHERDKAEIKALRNRISQLEEENEEFWRGIRGLADKIKNLKEKAKK